MTNLTPSAANLLATETPCLGSDPSSPYETMIFWPRMPPAALMSAAAWSTPFFICAPVAALGPVIGPPTASLTWADAVPVTRSITSAVGQLYEATKHINRADFSH